MNEPKRAKFSHPQVSRLPILEGPKTSEYAFFKKLKKDVVGSKSRSLHKEKIRSKIFQVNGHNRDTHTYSRVHESSSRSEKEGASNKIAFLSPTHIGSSNLGAQIGTSNGINQRSSLLRGDIVSFDQSLLISPYAGAGKNLGTLPVGQFSSAPCDPPIASENQYAEKDVFAVKRHRLRQLATDLFPEAGKCNSKGFDLVSALISRLLPRGNDTEEKTYPRKASKIQDGSCCYDVSPNYKFRRLRETNPSKPRVNETEYSNFKGRITNVEYSSYDFLKLDTPERTSPQNLLRIRDESPWDDVFPHYLCSGPTEKKVLSNWDMTASHLPCIKYYTESDFQDEEANYNCHADGGTIQYTFPDSDSYFRFRNNRQSNNDHMKQLYNFHYPELDGFYAPNESSRGEAHTLFLSLDVKDDKEEDLYCTSGDPLDFASQQVMDDSIENITPCLSSLYPNHYLDFLLRPYIHSTCNYMEDMRGNDKDDSAVPDADLFPLRLSIPAKHLTMEEYWDIFNRFENSNINLPQLDPPWCSSKARGMKGDFGPLLLSRGLDIDLGWKFLPKSDFLEYYSSNSRMLQFPFKEDVCSYAVEQDEELVLYGSPRKRTLASYDGAFSILNWSSPCSDVSLGKRMHQPLLLDYPDWGRTEEIQKWIAG